jgi:hypothetical protein
VALAPTRIVLFDSPPSTLAAAFTAFATAKAATCAAAASWFAVRALQPTVDAGTGGRGWAAIAEVDAEAVVERLVAGGWYAGGDARLAGILAVLAGLAAVTSRAAQRRIVWRLEAEVPVGLTPPPTFKQAMDDAVAREEDPWVTAATLRNEVAGGVTAEATRGHTILITRPTAWGGVGRAERVPRSHIVCAAPSTAMQSFRVFRGSGRWEENYLLPAPGWRTEHGAYLKTLLRGDYFRPDDAPPTPDIDLIAIEGFGPYRPAQFADPLHPGIARVAAVVQQASLPPPVAAAAVAALPAASSPFDAAEAAATRTTAAAAAAPSQPADARAPADPHGHAEHHASSAVAARPMAAGAWEEAGRPSVAAGRDDDVAASPEYGTALVMAVTGHIVPPPHPDLPPAPAVPLPGTPYRVERGTVWADFTVPERPSLLEARRISARAAMEGRTPGTLTPRPRPAQLVALDGDDAASAAPALLPPPDDTKTPAA